MPHYCMNIREENDSQIKHKSQPSQHIILQFIVLLLGIKHLESAGRKHYLVNKQAKLLGKRKTIA